MVEHELALIRVSAALPVGNPALEQALRAAAGGAQQRQVEEALLQSYLFLGYPAALRALAQWRELSGSAAGPASPDDWDAWQRRGEEVFARVYGGPQEKLRRNVAALHPDLDRWMVTEGYGKVLGRPGLELRLRELCIAAILAGISAPQQLYSHLRGALNVGASVDEVEEMLDVAGSVQGAARGDAARAVWRQVLARRVSP